MSDPRTTHEIQVSYDGDPVVIVEVFGPVADCDSPIRVPYRGGPHSSFEVGYQVGRWLSGEEADAGWSFAILSEEAAPSSI